MTDEEIYEEMRQDMMYEARENERIEHLLRTDYEFFCDYMGIYAIEEEIEKLKQEIKDIHEKHGWEVQDA